mgnify:CR=1 FL=1
MAPFAQMCLTCTVHVVHIFLMMISDWMQAQGLKDAQAAELFGCERSHFSKVRRGKVRPGTDLCLKVNEVTGIPLHELRPDIYPEPQAA